MSVLFGSGHENRQSLDGLSEAIARSERGSYVGATSVTPETALRLGAVWSCVDLICRLAALPIRQYKKRPDGSPVEVERSTLFTAPSAGMHLIGWVRQILISWLMRGNLFGAVSARDRLLYPTRMEVLDPRRMRATRRGPDGQLRWLVDGKDLGEDLIHWPAFTIYGTTIGLSPIEYAAATIGLGLYAGEFGSQWFEDGAHPSAILSTEKKVDAGEAATIKERFLRSIRGREPAVLGSSFKYEAIQVNANESQFLDTIKANKADIAGIFLVPPEMIGGESGNSQTYANVEQRGLSYLTYNAGWWLSLLEALFTSLVPGDEYVKINAGALVKVDLKTQAEVQSIRITGSWGKPDEARAYEELEPLPNGDGQRTVWPPKATTAPTQGGPSDG